MSLLAADTDLTRSRCDHIANHPGRAGVWQGDATTSRQSVKTLLGLPQTGWRISHITLGTFNDAMNGNQRLRVHVADEAAGVSIHGNSASVDASIKLDGWFDDLWISASTTLSAYVYMVIKPAKG